VDEDGQRILASLSGGDLPSVQRLFWPETLMGDWGMMPKLIIATDVQNPLLGIQGAAAVFAPQKGASEEQCQVLAQGLSHLRDLLAGQFTVDYVLCPGSGAAGGLAYGLQYWPGGAVVVSGSQWIAETLNLKQLVAEADVILSGEGRWDATSLGGKATGHLLTLAGNKPVFLLPGQCQAGLQLPATVQCLPLATTEAETQAAMANPRQALRTVVLQRLPLLKRHLPAH
jgi:glycerate kinase